LLNEYLRLQGGFETHVLQRGDEVPAWVAEHRPDLILLDLMLPGLDGLEVCKKIRRSSRVPIIMVTARVEEIDRLLGLELGADDYICKPFSPREVVARVKAVLRRTAKPIEPGDWVLDEGRFEFSWRGETVPLTSAEFNLLKKLCSEPGRIFSRGQLMAVMYRDNRVVSERTIDSHVKKLRAKLAMVPADEDFIESVYGIGYRFVR